MSQILIFKSTVFAKNIAGIWLANTVSWYNLWRLADLRNGVANGWWQVVWFFKCLIYSSRMFVIVNPAASWQCLVAQCSSFLIHNQIQNGQVKPKSNCAR